MAVGLLAAGFHFDLLATVASPKPGVGQQVYMHVIPGMDEEGANLAAAVIHGTSAPPDDPPVTNFVNIEDASPLL
ncbi:MAG: hypothetical protein ACT4NY_19435 [Pseudonocardiales bacterium]